MSEIKTAYTLILDRHETNFNTLRLKSSWVSLARLITLLSAVFFGYLFFKKDYSIGYVTIAIVLFASFIFLVKYYSKLTFQKKLEKAYIDINKNEIDFIENGNLPFPDGKEFVNPGHAYSYDLDFFGPHSLFQNLNRTETYFGSHVLANKLHFLQTADDIKRNQTAIKELTKELTWRQDIASLGKVNEDSAEIYNNLMRWSRSETVLQTKLVHVASYIMPVVFISLFMYNQLFNAGLGNYLVMLFFLNLGILGQQLKAIKRELSVSRKIDLTLKNYGLILQKIEDQNFTSEKLLELKGRLSEKGISASEQIKKLSNLFNQLDNVLDPFGATLFNGFLLYHVHVFRNFSKWKQAYAQSISEWLGVIAEFEALNSLANFSYNNPNFVFPEINDEYQMSFEALGHPLLSSKKRVCSDISFNKEKFIILTGSNMSGKSTFLRSLGVNMVLGGIGAPICATKASIHPMPVYVSMRVTDSLNDDESFFFAEVKRLKEVMDAAEKQISFVLLDEILRGTNSDDKRTGTVEVVKKIISKNAFGALATHDLKVCDTTAEYPNQLTNKCFEVEILNNELHFDYQLREGVCKNKSATFLMKKMGVI
jgi:ABC-type multidrug transport system fused ATPase/permease subunit